MSAAVWLERETTDAPEQLRAHMLGALPEAFDGSVADALAEASFQCLAAATRDPTGAKAALDLLSADALLTHACAAAAQQGGDELMRFTASLDAARFQQLLDQTQ